MAPVKLGVIRRVGDCPAMTSSHPSRYVDDLTVMGCQCQYMSVMGSRSISRLSWYGRMRGGQGSCPHSCPIVRLSVLAMLTDYPNRHIHMQARMDAMHNRDHTKSADAECGVIDLGVCTANKQGGIATDSACTQSNTAIRMFSHSSARPYTSLHIFPTTEPILLTRPHTHTVRTLSNSSPLTTGHDIHANELA